MNKVTVCTNGCPENRNDCARMESFLKLNGWTVENNFRESSLIAFNACGLTISQEENALRIIESINAQKNPDSRLIVWGCLPKINPKRLSTVYQGPTFGSDEPERISDFIDVKAKLDNLHANYIVPEIAVPCAPNCNWGRFRQVLDPIAIIRKTIEPAYRRFGDGVNLFGSNSYFIKTSTGCMCKCAYCAVRISRGTVKSKSIDRIKMEFEEGLNGGFTDFSLIATDLGSYGMDRGENLADLLDVLTRVPGEYQIRIRNIQPKLLLKMMDKMKRVIKRGKVSFIGATAQSGSDNVLRLMRRGYSADDYKYAIQELKSAYPALKVRTQMMVGFPGETEADFKDTLKMIDEVDFDFVETFIFQPRIGTAAAEMNNQIPENISKKRYDCMMLKILNHFAEDLKLRFPRLQKSIIRKLSAYYLS